MVEPKTLILLFVLLNAALVAVVVLRPSLTEGRGGKMLAFMAIFLFPSLAATMGLNSHIENSKTTQFCLSCHVMKDFGRSLRMEDQSGLAAAHFQNKRVPRDAACFACHTEYTMYGDYKAKLRGLRHVYVQYLGSIPERPKLYNPYNNRECLHCHQGARTFEDNPVHSGDPEVFLEMKKGAMSCLTGGCHDVAHNLDGLKDATLWKETD